MRKLEGSRPMASNRVTIGKVELVALADGQSNRDPLDTFPESTREQWAEFPELLDAVGHVHSRYGTTAVRSAGKLIIVDPGLQAPDGTLIGDMRANGIEPDAVDLVVLTHLHPDHVGWNLTDGRPTFPNARYLAPRTDWEYWSQPSVLETASHVRDQVAPLQNVNLLDLMDDGYNITDDLRAVGTPGHTPGHTSIGVSSGGQQAFILGDVAHTPAQAHYTDWNPVFDIDGTQSRKTRHEVFDRLEAQGLMVSAGHFPDPGFGRLVRRGGRRVWQGI